MAKTKKKGKGGCGYRVIRLCGYVKKCRKFEITETLLQILANFFKRKEPTFASQLLY